MFYIGSVKCYTFCRSYKIVSCRPKQILTARCGWHSILMCRENVFILMHDAVLREINIVMCNCNGGRVQTRAIIVHRERPSFIISNATACLQHRQCKIYICMILVSHDGLLNDNNVALQASPGPERGFLIVRHRVVDTPCYLYVRYFVLNYDHVMSSFFDR